MNDKPLPTAFVRVTQVQDKSKDKATWLNLTHVVFMEEQDGKTFVQTPNRNFTLKEPAGEIIARAGKGVD